MDENKVILYSYYESSCSYRVRIALNYKNIPHEITPVKLVKGFAGGEQHTEEFRRLNPMGFLPALVIDGITLIESMNILYYLEETRTTPRLIPGDLLQRVKMREICQIIVSGIQPLQNITVRHHVGDEMDAEWVDYYISKGFRAVEKLLEKSSGKYSIGDKITLADCCLIPQVYNARRYKVDLTPYPNILRVDEELENHPAFTAAHPKNQIDYVPKCD